MQRAVFYRSAVIAVVAVLLQRVAAFHPTLGRMNQYASPMALRSTVDSDNVMSAFEQAIAKLKAEGSPPADPTESLQKIENLIPRPPQTKPPTFQQQQQRKKNAVAVAVSKRKLTTAVPPSSPDVVSVQEYPTDGSVPKKQWPWGSTATKNNAPENSGAAESRRATSSSAAPRDNNINSATVAPNAAENTNVETIPKQKAATAERQVVSTIGGRMTVTPESKMTIPQNFATWQSWCIGAFVGVAAVTPVTLLHHFYFYPSYESLAQWEFDTVVALIQGAVFAAVYRYAIREDWNEEKLGKAVFTAFFLVRSLVGIKVPMSCSTPFLFCKLEFAFGVSCTCHKLFTNLLDLSCLFRVSSIFVTQARSLSLLRTGIWFSRSP